MDIPPSDAFTLTNAGSVVFGAFAVAFFTWLQGVLRTHADHRYKTNEALTAEKAKAEAEDRQNFRNQQQQFVDTLWKRVKESEARVDELDREREKLWITIRDLRIAIELCENKLGENAVTIRALEGRISALQKTVPPAPKPVMP